MRPGFSLSFSRTSGACRDGSRGSPKLSLLSRFHRWDLFLNRWYAPALSSMSGAGVRDELFCSTSRGRASQALCLETKPTNRTLHDPTPVLHRPSFGNMGPLRPLEIGQSIHPSTVCTVQGPRSRETRLEPIFFSRQSTFGSRQIRTTQISERTLSLRYAQVDLIFDPVPLIVFQNTASTLAARLSKDADAQD